MLSDPEYVSSQRPLFVHKGLATFGGRNDIYRYTLFRHLNPQRQPSEGALDFHCARPLMWIMLNPSTAGETKNDPTIRKVMGFTERAGYDGAWVTNIFAYRATDPKKLKKTLVLPDKERHNHRWCEGEENRAAIESVIAICSDQHASPATIVCAWGAQPWARWQAKRVLGWLSAFKVNLRCIGLTKDGDPLHPLMPSYHGHPLRSFNPGINPG